jgi:predicted AAA+ superfamily ATPase
MTNLNAKTLLKGNAIFTEFKGAMTEQFVFQQLIQNEEIAIHYFAFENSKYEIDFIIQNEEDKIIPVETKSGENLKSRSFKLFCEKYKPKTAIRTSLSNYHTENWMTNMPLYIVGCYFHS